MPVIRIELTQLATLLFASRSPGNLIAVFVGASAALVVASAIGVVAGGVISQYVSPKQLSYVAGVGFLPSREILERFLNNS